MSLTLSISLVRRWSPPTLAGQALLVALLLLVWTADANQRGAGGETLPDDLKLVPGDTSAFVTVRVADLLNSDTGKKVMPGLRKAFDPAVSEQEDFLGVPLASIERLTFLVPNNEAEELAVIVCTSRPYDRKRLLGLTNRPLQLAGKTIYERKSPYAFLYLVSEKVLVWGGKRFLSEAIAGRAKKGAEPINDALKRAAAKHHVVMCIQPELVLLQQSRDTPEERKDRRAKGGDKGKRSRLERLLDEMPEESLPYRPLFQARSVIITAVQDADIRVNAELRYADAELAQDGATAVRTTLYVARHLLPRRLRERIDLAPGSASLVDVLSRRGQQSLKTALIEREKNSVRASIRVKVDADMLTSTLDALSQQAPRQRARNDLKQLGTAAHLFADMNEFKLFGPAICDKDGKPLLSWRVTLLPYLKQGALYREFKLDEPWDSPHNKKLLKKMPAVFAPAVGKTKEPYSTYYRVFTGPNGLFDLKKVRPGPEGLSDGYTLMNIPDGTAYTIMIVEAAEAVPWTKPDELVHDRKKPLPKLGAQFPEGFLVVTAEANVRMVRKSISEETLRNAIDPADGGIVGSDW